MRFPGIDQSITYGDSVTILDTNAGITDTGTTLLYIASDAFEAYANATGGQPDNSVGLLSITDDQFASLQSLFFKIGDVRSLSRYIPSPHADLALGHLGVHRQRPDLAACPEQRHRWL